MENNKKDSHSIDPLLVERFASGNGTVFVGAGISMRSRLPSWRELMEPLRDELGERIPQSANHLDVAELYEAAHSRSDLVRYLKKQLGDVRYQLSRTHELIVSLPVQRIYTTNFDDLLEQAAHRKLINRSVIHDASQVGFSDTSTLSIVKLHGDLAAPNSLVISANDYYGYFTKNPAVADLLKVELQTHTVLFLGYSFSDPDFGMILGKVAAQSGPDRPLLYALQLNPNELAARGLERRGIKVIPLKAAPGTRQANEEIEHWLDCFLQTLRKYERRRHQLPSLQDPMHDAFAIPKYKHSLIRLRTLRRIEEGLRADFRVVAVQGEAGVGKTQLVATATANMLMPGGAVVVNDVFERVIWIRAMCTGQPHTLDRILQTILNSIETFPSGSLSIKDKENEASRVLQERRVIVVIEDLEEDRDGGAEIPAIRNWIEHLGSEANPRSRIVVTSRSLILPGFVVEVDRLSPAEARDMLAEHAESIMLRRLIPDGLTEETADWLARYTLGNPQAIQLALGLFCGTRGGPEAKATLARVNRQRHIDIELVFAGLIDAALEALSLRAHRILRAMLVFPDSEPVPAEMLRVASGMVNGTKDAPAFAQEANSCVQFGLLDWDVRSDTFGMHRTSKKLLETRLVKRGHDESFRRLADYLLDFLRDKRDHNVICRREIDEEYWNALVRDQMSRVDPYWPIIKHVMLQAGTTPLIAEFVFLLVHYMDSRFLNAERTLFLQAAMQALKKCPEKQALLRIDALAWTYMENGEHQQARDEIAEGLKKIDQKKHLDLVALAESWLARMASEQGMQKAADEHLRKARDIAEKLAEAKRKPWIRMRVKMMEGDVAHREGELDKALQAYREAERLAETYGGEGDGYQTSPRIGLALLEQEHDPAAQEQAAQRFRKLVENSQVATGRLYGQYGNALIAARNRSTYEAIAQLQAIHQEIHHLGHGNVLLGLAQNLYRKTLKERPSYTERMDAG